MWSEVEAYRQLERDYERALGEYTSEETAYREALDAGMDPDKLAAMYERLGQMRTEVEKLYERLTQMRRELATSREKGPISFGT